MSDEIHDLEWAMDEFGGYVGYFVSEFCCSAEETDATYATHAEAEGIIRAALRAAQPLTREGIDGVIETAIAANEKTHPLAPEFSPTLRHGMRLLRDALLDSLADKGGE